MDTGDFWTEPGQDCVLPWLFRDVLIVLSILTSLGSLWTRLIELYKAHLSFSEFRGGSKNPFLRILRFHQLGLVTSLSGIITSVGYWTWRNDLIGRHIPKTIFFAISGFILWFTAHYTAKFCIDSVAIILGTLRPGNQHKFLLFVKRYSPAFTFPGQFIISIVCPIGIFHSTDGSFEKWDIIITAFALYLSISFAIVLLLTFQGLIQTLHEAVLRSRYQSQKQGRKQDPFAVKLTGLIERAKSAKLWTQRFVVLNISICFIICVWPWARPFIVLEPTMFCLSLSICDIANCKLGQGIANTTTLTKISSKISVFRDSIRTLVVRSSQVSEFHSSTTRQTHSFPSRSTISQSPLCRMKTALVRVQPKEQYVLPANHALEQISLKGNQDSKESAAEFSTCNKNTNDSS